MWETLEDGLPLDIILVQLEKQKELIHENIKLSAYIQDHRSDYSQNDLENDKIIWYDRKIYVLISMHRCVIYWYYFYLNHFGGSRLDKKIQQV